MSNYAPATLENVIAFIRERMGIFHRAFIGAESLLESDLGITGDDGIALLEAAEKEFGVRFSSDENGVRNAFGLAENEVLFHGEGFSLFAGLVKRMLGLKPVIVHPLTVGRFQEVIHRLQTVKGGQS